MGLIEELRKKFQKENADKLIRKNVDEFIEISFKINGNGKKLWEEITEIQKSKIGRKRKGAKL